MHDVCDDGMQLWFKLNDLLRSELAAIARGKVPHIYL
jgi:hypothetical protein